MSLHIMSGKYIIKTISVSLLQVLTEKYVFMDDTKDHVAAIGFSKDPRKCDLYIAKEKFFKTGFGFPLPPGSPYLPLFNKRWLNSIAAHCFHLLHIIFN